MVVGDNDLGLVQLGEHVAWNQLTALVVAVRVVGLQHAQTVLDGDAGCDHQEATGESAARRATHSVDGLPGNQHSHNSGLTRASGKLEGQPHQTGVGVVTGIGQVFEKAFAGPASGRGDLSQPDGGLNRFDLTEERLDIVKLVMSPMLKQAGGFRRDMPVGWIWSFSPLVYLAADCIDIRSRVVLLLRS